MSTGTRGARLRRSRTRGAGLASSQMPLVYNQSWEDPDLDVTALAPVPGHRVLTIASGGCNVLHLALTGAEVVAIDRNPAQVALTELKVAAARQLPPERFRRVFSTGRDAGSELSRLDLSPVTRRFVLGRGWFRGRGLYAAGAFGLACSLLRRWARMCGASFAVEATFQAQDLPSQAAAWHEARRRIRGPVGRAMLATPFPLLAFGVPVRVWRQVQGGSTAIADWVDVALTRFPARDNWFWQRAFLDEYRTAMPPYLKSDLGGLGPVQTQVAELGTFLAASRPGAFDAAVLLDAVHWVSPLDRPAVWQALHRALRPGGKVTLRRFTGSSEAPAALFEEVPLEAMDRTGCYAGASLILRR
jgi:S-adenosylmethionine-diacylglycerol 3-amino-3-carboxypropyl transferase